MKTILPLMFLLVSAPCVVMGADDPVWSLQPGDDGVTLRSSTGRDILGYLKTKPAGSALTANSTCCVFPLLTPAGVSVVALAPADHRHHRGVFFAWYHVIGQESADFWGWGAHAPTENRRVVNTSLELAAPAADGARMEIRNEWRSGESVMLHERLTIKSREMAAGNWHELAWTLTPVVETRVPRSAFGGFCVKAEIGAGGVVSSPDGPVVLAAPKHDDPTTGWPDAPWYDYTASMEGGRLAGVSVFSHPSNPVTRWHNPASIAMLNPCVLMDGDLVLRPDQPLTLRYAVLAHDGPVPVADLDKLAAAFRASH